MPKLIAARVDNPTAGIVPPPPGVEPDFDHPYSRQGLMLGVNFIGLVFVVIFFCVRMWTRLRLTKYVGWDDYTCVFAMVLVVVHSAGSLELLKHGLGVHAWNIRQSTFNSEEAYKWAVIMFSISIATLAVIKISILLLYRRIFSLERGMKLAIYALLCFMVSYVLAFELSLAFSCQPVRKLIQPELPGRCFNSQAHALTNMILNIASDLLVFILPIPTSLALRLPKRRKFALLVIYLVGMMYETTRPFSSNLTLGLNTLE
ncbi:MAG: hypothetical protein M1816_004368 [Peltula sp. TS41687]|nr:MAG: hypothetical protein M1816_004368 [Peltula sp. TS41687]